MLIEAFGTIAVSVMAIAYGLEKRPPSFVLGFAAGCAASSLYAVLIRAWPLAVLEFLALRRWFHQMREPDTVAKETDRISACHAGGYTGGNRCIDRLNRPR